MRELIKKYGLVLAIALILLAGVLLIKSFRKSTVDHVSGDPTLAFYIDEANGEETVRSVNENPPLAGKDGKPTVVRAIKYTCDDGTPPKVLYYFKYTDEVAKELNTLSPTDAAAVIRRTQIMPKGEMVRSPATGSQWLLTSTPEGDALRAYPQCPNGKTAKLVFPQKR